MSMFDSIKGKAPRRNKFDLSHERKFSLKMGGLYPILLQEIVPGDRFRVSTEILLRMAPMLAPVMHRVNVFTHYFFVPNRLLWNEWENFITGGEDGLAAPVWPHVLINDASVPMLEKGKLADYFGLPLRGPSGVLNENSISVLPFRAYNKIYNEYYRDQNLIPKLQELMSSGNNVPGADFQDQILFRAWEKDYYTSALPWAQRGATVGIPNTYVPTEAGVFTGATGAPLASVGNLHAGVPPSGPADGKIYLEGDTVGANPLGIDPGALNITINDLRKSARLQEFLELAARAGSRYVEHIKAFFGVRSSDARLQRPEFLGGGRSPVVISEVLSNFQQVGGEIPQGYMAGHGISVGNANGFSRDFEEHGLVIGIMSVLPKTAYQQGINKMWSRSDKFDYYNPMFANIGEQEIKLKELWYDTEGAAGEGEETFGYQSRFAEYKYKESSVHGDFRDNLSYWHMGRILQGKPTLNGNFVTSDPTTRIYNVTDPDIDTLYCQLYHSVSAIRPMPYYGTPSL